MILLLIHQYFNLQEFIPIGVVFIFFISYLVGVGGFIVFCVNTFIYCTTEKNEHDNSYDYYIMRKHKRYNIFLCALLTIIALAWCIGYLFCYTKVSDALTPNNGVSKIYLIEKSGCSDCINAELNGDIDYAKSLMTKLYESNSIDSIVYIENISSKDNLIQVDYINDDHLPISDLSYEDYLEYTGVTWVPSIVIVNSDGQTLEIDWDEENGWPDNMSVKILDFI